jgi:PKD repeat protein
VNFCGALPAHQSTSSNPASILYDRFGNTYDKFEVDSTQQISICNSGYFTLIFGNSPSPNYEEVICQVFEEISNLIPRRQQEVDCGDEIPLGLPVIRISGVPNLGRLAGSSSLYEYITENCNDFNYPTASNLVYRFINGGHDVFYNNARIGIIAINTSLNWNLSFINGPNVNEYDLRSVVMHQVMHLLGFYSTMGIDGIPITNGGLYDYYDNYLYRYDVNTRTNGTKVTIGDCLNNCWHLNPAITNFEEDVKNSCDPSIYTYGIGDPFIAATANKDDFDSNISLDNYEYLSHLSENCNANGMNLLMRPKFTEGERRVLIQAAEQEILCKLGYQINLCNGCPLIAHFERTNNTSAFNCCTKLYNACTNDDLEIDLTKLLCNDIGENKEITDVFFSVNQQFPNQAMQVTWNYGDPIAIVRASSPGYYRLSYTTKGCDCKLDNAYIEILIGVCCTPDPPCVNLVCTNGFEEFDEGCSLSYSIGQRFWGFEGNTYNCVNFENGPNKFVGLFAIHDVVNGLCFKLKEPILNGCSLNISFKAYTGEADRELIILGSEMPPCEANDKLVAKGCLNVTACSGYDYEPDCISNGIPIAIGSVFTSYSINNFVNPGLPMNYIIIYPNDYFNQNFSSQIFIDDVIVQSTCSFIPDFTFSDCFDYQITFTAFPEKPGFSYNWDFADGNTATGRNVSHNYQTNGSYTVTLTVTDECNNSKTVIKNVLVNCPNVCNCQTDYVVGHNQNSVTNIDRTQIPALLGYKSICINGRLNINRAHQIFNHCTIFFAPGASIAVNSNSRLTSGYSNYLACQGKMYLGIIADPGSTLYAFHNTIQDAEIGIELNPGARIFSLTQNAFIGNHIGISMPQGGDFTSPIITSNHFSSLTGLLPPRSGELTYAGIYTNGALAIIKHSDFTNMRNGIICENNSIVFVEDDCEFTDMIPVNLNSVAGSPDGTGIYTDRSILAASNCTISNSLIGISTNNSWILNLSDNTIQNDRAGIHDRFSYGPGTIVNNHINEYGEQGIRIDNPSNGIFFSINDNTFTNQNAQSSSQMEAAAIFLDNVRSLQALIPSQLVHNIIAQRSSHKGIFARNCDNIAAQINEVHYNGFDLYGNSGIELQNVENSAFYSNTVDGQTQNNLIPAGFNASFSPLNIYCCNDVDFTAFGFVFTSDCDQSIWRQNFLKNHFRALFIQSGSYFGRQPNYGPGLRTSPGNQWSSSIYPNSGGFHAYNGNGAGSALTQLSNIFPQTCNSPYWPPTIFPIQSCSFKPGPWFILAESLINDCEHDEGCPALTFGNPLINADDYLTMSDTFVARGELLIEDHGLCLNFESQKRLFGKLHEHPEIRIAESPTDSFYLANLNTDLYSLSKVDSIRYKAMSYGNDILEVLNESKDSILHYIVVLKTLDSLYAIASTWEDSLELENEMTNTAAIIELFNSNIVNEVSQFKADKLPLIALAENINNEITENDLLYSNITAVIKIYFQTIAMGLDTLTSGQRDSLFNISNQCPLDGGKAVYMARSLYNLYGPLDINDDSICMPTSPIIISSSEDWTSSEIKYFPVPFKDEFILQIPTELKSEFEISFIEIATEKIIKKFKFKKINEELIKLNIRDVSQGMYIFTLKNNGILVSTGRIIKIN